MLRPFLAGCVITELILVGYAIGKYRLDQKAAQALKQAATDAIAYAKAVPPAAAVTRESLAVKRLGST